MKHRYKKVLMTATSLSVLFACVQGNTFQTGNEPVISDPSTKPGVEPSVLPQPNPSLPTPAPTQRPAASPTQPTPSLLPPPPPLTTPDSDPVVFYEGALQESFSNNDAPLSVLDEAGNGMIAWPGGERLAVIKNYQFDALVPADLRFDFGRAQVALDTQGNGIMAWDSSPLLGTGQLEVSTSFQKVENYRPTGVIQRLEDYGFIRVEIDNSGEGYLMVSKKTIDTELLKLPIHAGDLDLDAIPLAKINSAAEVLHGGLSSEREGFVLFRNRAEGKRLEYSTFSANVSHNQVLTQETKDVWINSRSEGAVVWSSEEDEKLRMAILNNEQMFPVQEVDVPVSKEKLSVLNSRFAVNTDGNGLLVWQTDKGIKAARIQKGRASSGVLIENKSENIRQLSLSLDAKGDGIVWWVSLPQAVLDAFYANRGDPPGNNPGMKHIVRGRFIRGYQFQ